MTDAAPAIAPTTGSAPVTPTPAATTPADSSVMGGAAPVAEPAAPPAEGEAKSAAGPLDTAKLTFPEGYKANPAELEKFSGIAKKFGLSQEAAQELVNLQGEALKGATSASQTVFEKQQSDWQNAIKSDPEVGGAKLTANLATISKAIDQYGTPGFKDALNQTGAGNNPDVFKTFLKMAQALSEGGAVQGSPPAQAPKGGGGFEGMASRMYPSMQGNG